jgi:hypothetical protein
VYQEAARSELKSYRMPDALEPFGRATHAQEAVAVPKLVSRAGCRIELASRTTLCAHMPDPGEVD